MAEGDAVVKDAYDLGVPMVEGSPDEPTGPEDAAGHGVKRGSYVDRIEPGKEHYQFERGADGNVYRVNQNELMDNVPGVPADGTKGGVDSGALEDDDTLVEAANDPADDQPEEVQA